MERVSHRRLQNPSYPPLISGKFYRFILGEGPCKKKRGEGTKAGVQVSVALHLYKSGGGKVWQRIGEKGGQRGREKRTERDKAVAEPICIPTISNSAIPSALLGSRREPPPGEGGRGGRRGGRTGCPAFTAPIFSLPGLP